MFDIKLDAIQKEAIVDKVVPLLASKQDEDFFRAVIRIKLDECANAIEAHRFIKSLLEA